MNRFTKFFFIVLFLMIASNGYAQKTIKGSVTNAQTGEPLPMANIIIKGVYQGTVSNPAGQFSLSIPDSLLPATIEISFIGYYTEQRTITRQSTQVQNFKLKPSVAQLAELAVSAKKLDLSIMERVIYRKQQWIKKLHNYKANAYSRQVLNKDSTIVSITESISNVYWDKQKGTAEVVKWRKQTKNLDIDNNFAGVNYLPNLYDDNIDIMGFNMVGVTNTKAPDYYNFEVTDTLSINGKAVYKIKVTPHLKLQPLFEGTVYILSGEYAMIRANLSPNEVVRIPLFLDELELSYHQQFNNFGSDIWVPIDIRITGDIKIDLPGLNFPTIHFKQLGHITDYTFNVEIPDSVFKEGNDVNLTVVDTVAVSDSALAVSVPKIPLTPKEQKAYSAIDSSDTIEKAFKPSGFLSKFIDMADDSTRNTNSSSFNLSIPGNLAPRLRFNRVEGLYAGLKYHITPIGNLQLMGEGGYSTASKYWSYGGGLQYSFYKLPLNPTIGVLYRLNTTPRYASLIFNPTMTLPVNLLGYENYFDYFRNEGLEFYLKLFDPKTDLGLHITFVSKEQTSLPARTEYDILARHNPLRANPTVNEGRLNAVSFNLTYNGDATYSYGLTGFKQFSVEAEISSDELGSDFNYTRFSGNISWSFETLFQRRLFPNTLQVWLKAGTYTGTLPYQKFGIIDVTEGVFSPFGVLHTVRFRPYEGTQFAALHVEHDFRTVPFELLHLNWLVEHNIGLIAFASVAKTHISESRISQITARTGYIPFTTDGLHSEAGLSITGILSAFRVDFAYRIDEPGWFIGIGLTRFF